MVSVRLIVGVAARNVRWCHQQLIALEKLPDLKFQTTVLRASELSGRVLFHILRPNLFGYI